MSAVPAAWRGLLIEESIDSEQLEVLVCRAMAIGRRRADMTTREAMEYLHRNCAGVDEFRCYHSTVFRALEEVPGHAVCHLDWMLLMLRAGGLDLVEAVRAWADRRPPRAVLRWPSSTELQAAWGGAPARHHPLRPGFDDIGSFAVRTARQRSGLTMSRFAEAISWSLRYPTSRIGIGRMERGDEIVYVPTFIAALHAGGLDLVSLIQDWMGAGSSRQRWAS
jgi:hypothetical protein